MDSNFEAILEELKELHQEFPDIRFGQIIQSAVDISKKGNNSNLNDITSKQLLNSLKDFKAKTGLKRKLKRTFKRVK